TTDIVHAAEPGGSDIFKAFEQGYLSWLAPVGKGLQFDAGKFVTPAGAEVIETKDNWNYSRSLLFALAIPYYHMGVRATYNVNDDYGKDRIAGVPVRWQGVAAYARYQVIPTWAVTPRVEWVDDKDAFMTGTSQTLKEFTITSENKIDGGLLARLEFRRDMSDV